MDGFVGGAGGRKANELWLDLRKAEFFATIEEIVELRFCFLFQLIFSPSNPIIELKLVLGVNEMGEITNVIFFLEFLSYIVKDVIGIVEVVTKPNS